MAQKKQDTSNKGHSKKKQPINNKKTDHVVLDIFHKKQDNKQTRQNKKTWQSNCKNKIFQEQSKEISKKCDSKKTWACLGGGLLIAGLILLIFELIFPDIKAKTAIATIRHHENSINI